VDLLGQQVFESFKEGNQSAFEMLFRTYYQPLCNYAFSFLNDKDEAEEVVQSVFMTVWDKREAIDIQTSVKAYLYRMVRNACLNVLKHEKIKLQHASYEMAGGEPHHENASESVVTSELEEKIYEAIKSLPEQCRLVFQLSRFEEMKYAEIADQLSISVKTVENQMGKALRVMRQQLKDYLPFILIILKTWIL
jgi:RNA polymerase sigma-70 factor (ECF subfamily)